MKAAVILSGCGVYDGAEIHESVLTLLALEEEGIGYQIFAPNKKQHHVINHLTGEEMPEERNVMVEAARIARGAVTEVKDLDMNEFDLLILPGGFGAAKNLNQWALKGPEGELDAEVAKAIQTAFSQQKVLVGLCMGPTVLAQALKDAGKAIQLTVGSTEAPSPYDIAGINAGLSSIGSRPSNSTKKEVTLDHAHKVVTAPCYTMEASLFEVRKNIQQAIRSAKKMVG